MKILFAKNTSIVPGSRNAKEYPWFDELYELLKKDFVPQVKEIEGVLPFEEILEMIKWADVVISVDSFLPHMIRFHNIDKKVIVLWGKSDPNIFGYKEHINLLKDRKFLRNEQFKWWKDEPYLEEAFIRPEEIIEYL